MSKTNQKTKDRLKVMCVMGNAYTGKPNETNWKICEVCMYVGVWDDYPTEDPQRMDRLEEQSILTARDLIKSYRLQTEYGELVAGGKVIFLIDECTHRHDFEELVKFPYVFLDGYSKGVPDSHKRYKTTFSKIKVVA